MTDGSHRDGGPPTVLVVDDERDIADLYTTWLEDSYEVRTAYGPQEALEKADEDLDVSFLDRQMPGMTGDEVLEEIRERDLDCRVVMVTAVDPDFDIVEMSFDKYLTKPVMMSDLTDVIEEMLTRSTYDEQLQTYFSLASKKATLEAQKDAVELQSNDTYARLESKVQEMAVETEGITAEMDHQDFESMFQEFPSG